MSPADPRALGPRVRMMLPGMSPSETRTVAILMDRGLDAAAPLKQVAEAAGVSEAMVVKTAKKLGFVGFRDLRAALARYKQQPTVDLHDELRPGDTAHTILHKVFNTAIQALQETLAILDVSAFEQAADLLHGARNLDFYGLGGSAQIARDVAHKFLRIGIRAAVHDDTHMMAMSASLLGPGDVVVVYSHSGQSTGVLDAAQLAKAGGATIIAVTNYATSPLAEIANIVLCSTAQGSPLTGENAAARIAQLNILDAVFVAVAERSYAEAERNLARTMMAVRGMRR